MKHEWVTLSKDSFLCRKCGIKIYNQTVENYENKGCATCFATDRLKAGTIIYVRAWWNNDSLVKCMIESIYKESAVVNPLEGNPHLRFVDIDTFIF